MAFLSKLRKHFRRIPEHVSKLLKSIKGNQNKCFYRVLAHTLLCNLLEIAILLLRDPFTAELKNTITRALNLKQLIQLLFAIKLGVQR